jgi:phosphoglycerate dehydrogenase-like enzyme
MLVIGLGGTGTQVARRGHAFGMRVRAVDARTLPRPDFVFSLDLPDRLPKLLLDADVVVLACPLTQATRGMIGVAQLAHMKKTALLVNVARGNLVLVDDLAQALADKKIAGAGLGVTDATELPLDHPLRKMANVVLSPRGNGRSSEAAERQWRLFRENVRRFAAGEPLLCVVEAGKGWYSGVTP